MIGCAGILLLMYNAGAYITVDERGISAKFALYDAKYWSRSEIHRFEYVGKTLTVILNNGKEYQIPFLDNAKEVYQCCKKTFQAPQLLPREKLKENLKIYSRKQLKHIHFIGISFVVLFADIIVSAMYIGDTLSNLSPSQTWCFVAMVAVCTACVILAFVFAGRGGKYTTQIRRTQSDLIRIIAREKAKDDIDQAVTYDVKYFDGYKYRISFLKFNGKGPHEGKKLYSFILWRFDLEKENWIVAIEIEQFFDSEQAVLDYVYEMFSDADFEE